MPLEPIDLRECPNHYDGCGDALCVACELVRCDAEIARLTRSCEKHVHEDFAAELQARDVDQRTEIARLMPLAQKGCFSTCRSCLLPNACIRYALKLKDGEG